MTFEPSTSNYQKFQTKNPLVQGFIGKFYARLENILGGLSYESFLDAGCGEGSLEDRLKHVLPKKGTGFDMNESSVAFAQNRHSEFEFSVASIFEIPFESDSFDIVVCCEVLEHLENPELALAELVRVARSEVLITVPFEPWFQLGNLCRGKYLKGLGNHPEHINHWNVKTLGEFLGETGAQCEVTSSFPWLVGRIKL